MISNTNRKLRVFHGLVNYGTQAGMLAQGLREQGIDAISVSYPDTFKRLIDIELLHGGNITEKIFKTAWNFILRFYWFFRCNTFHFYFGKTLLPNQWDLPLYNFFGKKVLMEYLGYDVQLYQYSIDKYEITNVRYYKLPEESILADIKKTARLKSEVRFLDKQLVCAPYLSEFVPGSTVLPLAIDLKEYIYNPKSEPMNEITIMHAPTSRDNKGTSFILTVIDRLNSEGYNIRKLLVENVSHAELKQNYIECDIFIDQVLAGWYGTASIEAMALGRPTICFIRESYYEYIEYGGSIPIINAQPSTLYEILKKTIDEKHLLPEIGKKSREFVEKVHNHETITKDLIEIYNSL